MKKPRVLLFGNISQKPFVNNLLPVVRAFEKISELTVVEPYLTPGFVPTGAAAPAPIPPDLVRDYAAIQRDLVLCLGGGLFFSGEGRELWGQDCVTAGVALSDPLGIEASIAIAPHFDIYYTHDENSVVGYTERGIDVRFCAAATDPELYRPSGVERDVDLLFYGKWTPWRNELLTRLSRRLRVAIHTYAAETRWSIPTRPPLDDPQSLTAAVSRAKLALEFSVVEDCGRYTGTYRITNRPQIAACCETPALIERFEHLSHYFEPGEEIETFGDENELERKIDALLADEPRREEMGRRARQRVIRDQSWDQRAAAILADAEAFRRNRGGAERGPLARAFKRMFS
jgi:spore maturation protein CgeB